MQQFGVGLDLPADTLILIIAVIVAAAVAFLELRYIRTRRHVKVDQYLEQDDAYNAVTTARAVASSLSRNGRNTSDADVLIYQAEMAYDRREFVRCMELSERAKNLLKNSKERDPLTASIEDTGRSPDVKEVRGGEEGKTVPANEIKKLPPNYLESKFLLDTVSSMMPDARSDLREEAQKELDQAQASYETGDYSEALKRTLKAKRILSPSDPAKSRPPANTTIIKPQSSPSVPAAIRCVKCGASLGPNDDFCYSCGMKSGVRVCGNCQTIASSEDVFCRKCGCTIEQ